MEILPQTAIWAKVNARNESDGSNIMMSMKEAQSPMQQKSYSESQGSSFAGGPPDHFQDSMSEEDDDEELTSGSNNKVIEESKEVVARGGRSTSSQQASNTLPDMWN